MPVKMLRRIQTAARRKINYFVDRHNEERRQRRFEQESFAAIKNIGLNQSNKARS